MHHSKLPYIINGELNISGSIAVVGSSAKLLETEYGNEIDKFDCVARFNRAPTEGYEQYVGSKTNIRITNPHVFGCRPYCQQDTNFVLKQKNVDFLVIGPENNQLRFDKHVGNIDSSCRAFRVNLAPIYQRFQQQPTVGMAFLVMLADINVVPTVYGFYGIPGRPDNEGLTHYWEDRKNSSVCHNYSNEREILKNLHNRGYIIWKN